MTADPTVRAKMSRPPAPQPTESADLFESAYERLHALAERYFRGPTPSATLQPTALIHEVYVRLAQTEAQHFSSQEHFLAVAATAMRQIIIDQARHRRSKKRGGDQDRVPLEEALDTSLEIQRPPDALELDQLITQLAKLHARQAKVVEYRVFVGLTVPEVAAALKVSVGTVEKDWRRARAWMRVQLAKNLS